MKRQNIKEVIREFFFTNPSSKLRVRQIERKLKLPLPSVIRYIKELEKEKIIRKLAMENVIFYSADRTSKKFLLEKRLFNIKQIYNSGLIEFLIGELSNPAISVFGSYSKGEDIEKSDIDLYVETPSKKSCDLSGFEKKLDKKIQLFIYKSVFEIKNKELANNIINGIILNGFIELLK